MITVECDGDTVCRSCPWIGYSSETEMADGSTRCPECGGTEFE